MQKPRISQKCGKRRFLKIFKNKSSIWICKKSFRTSTRTTKYDLRQMKGLFKGDYWGSFWNSNEDISATRRAMSAIESAFESWGFIFFDGRNFWHRRIFYVNPQMKMSDWSILQKWPKITKNGVDCKIMHINRNNFFLKEFWSP